MGWKPFSIGTLKVAALKMEERKHRRGDEHMVHHRMDLPFRLANKTAR